MVVVTAVSVTFYFHSTVAVVVDVVSAATTVSTVALYTCYSLQHVPNVHGVTVSVCVCLFVRM